MRIATFNVQNMRLHVDAGHVRLEGARDDDVPEDSGPGATVFDHLDRRLTAAVLRKADADVVALQEVFDRATLDHFHDAVLVPAGAAPYPYRICLPGNDGRGLDVALMSRRVVDAVGSHAAVTPASLSLEPIAEGPAAAFANPAGVVRTLPHRPLPGQGGLVGLDGFFAARFRRL